MLNQISNDPFAYNWTHHLQEEMFIPRRRVQYGYYNYTSFTVNTVDYQLLSSVIKISAAQSASVATLQSLGTLSALSASMTIGAPSLYAVSNCMSLFNSEISRSFSYNKIWTTYTMNEVDEDNYQNYFIDIKNSDFLFDLEKLFLINGPNKLLSTLYLFDELINYKVDGQNYWPVEKWDELLRVCYNISNLIYFETFYLNSSFVQSLASLACLQFTSYNTLCNRYKGEYRNSCFYSWPLYNRKADRSIHNVLFRNAFPYFDKYQTKWNDFASLFSRYLFLTQYSSFDTMVNQCVNMRTSFINGEGEKFIFKNITFRDQDQFETVENWTLKKYISFDSLSHMINELRLSQSGMASYDHEWTEIYQNLVSLSKGVFNIIGDVQNLKKENQCTLNSDALSKDDANLIYEKMKNLYFDENQSLSEYSLSSNETDWKADNALLCKNVGAPSYNLHNLFRSFIGDSITLGQLYAPFSSAANLSFGALSVWARISTMFECYIGRKDLLLSVLSSKYYDIDEELKPVNVDLDFLDSLFEAIKSGNINYDNLNMTDYFGSLQIPRIFSQIFSTWTVRQNKYFKIF